MGIVNQHQLSAFSSPVNGTTPIDANVVRGNANTIVTAYNAHDADTTIHLQNGAIASRPAASTAGQMWLATDSGAVFLTLDTGSAWVDMNYIKTTATSLPSNVHGSSLTSVGVLASPHMTSPVIDSGGLTVTSGGITALGVSTITATFLTTGTGGGITSGSGANITSGLAGNIIVGSLGALIVTNPPVPSTASDTGTKGMISYASGFVYVCVATNTWQRVAIATW